MLEKFQSLPPEKQTENMASAFGDGMDQMVNYVYDHYDNFKLLLRCSDNGKYGDMIHNLVDRLLSSLASAPMIFRTLGCPIGVRRT